MNIAHAKRARVFLKTTEKCDVIFVRRFSPLSTDGIMRALKGTTFMERNDLGEQFAKTIQKKSIFPLLLRSMLRWVVRGQTKDSHKSTPSIRIIGGAPASGKSYMIAQENETVVYDSDSDKLHVLFLLGITPHTFASEEALVVFLTPSGVKIEWFGDYLQPLHRVIRENIFKGLADLCYNVIVIGLHTNVESLQRTADAFKEYKDCSIHLVDIFEQPVEQARRLGERARAASHFAILPITYARKAATALHRMISEPALHDLAESRNAPITLTTIGSFREPLGRCKTDTKVLVRTQRPRSNTM